jgi:peptidoglycan-associated lipoprotein
MGVEKIGLKAFALAAAVLLAACETATEPEADKSSSGAATTTTTTKSQPAPPASVSQIKPGTQEHLVLNVGDRVFFDFDKSELKPDARATIERWADYLKQFPELTVTIEGHADERGTREYNLGLGERRASSALNYLVALGVNSARVGTISYGKERPVCVTSDEGCWSQNRRGVLTIN